MGDEEKESIKREISQDLGRGYYKMSQAKIITLIGCTITACLTVFGGILYLEKDLAEIHTTDAVQDSKITELNSQKNNLWSAIGSIDLRLNNQKNDTTTNTRTVQ